MSNWPLSTRDLKSLEAVGLMPGYDLMPTKDTKDAPHPFGGRWPWSLCWCERTKDSPTGVHNPEAQEQR